VAVTTRLLGAYKYNSPLEPLSESLLLFRQLLIDRKMQDESTRMREITNIFFMI
jgi:hypothetical protein